MLFILKSFNKLLATNKKKSYPMPSAFGYS